MKKHYGTPLLAAVTAGINLTAEEVFTFTGNNICDTLRDCYMLSGLCGRGNRKIRNLYIQRPRRE